MVDITERKWVEEALRESEERFRELADLLPIQIFEFDVDGNFTYANRTAFEQTGFTQSDMEKGVNARQTTVPEDYDRMLENVGKAFRGEDPGTPEYTGVRKDGTTYPILTAGSAIVRDGQVVGLRGFAIDITERKQAEEALRESEEKYRGLVDMASDGITIIQDSIIKYVNPRSEDMLGYTVAEITGTSMADYIHPDELPKAMDRYKRRMAGEDVPSVYETVFIHKDGHDVHVEVSARPINYYGGVADFVIVRDISERKKVEDQKQRMEQQLLLSGRLAAVGELAAGVAHELNNPLAAVQGFAQLLASREDLEESIREDVDTIHREAKRASKITTNLLSFARKHDPEMRMICLNEVIESCLELHAYRMRVNNIEVVAELAPDLPMTMADFHQLQQVCVNIITNAEQAMTEARGSGNLSVKTEVVKEEVWMTFTDDGPGISEEDLGRLFDPFFTTKAVGKGTGLGLSICYGIVDQHGGRIRAESKPGEGTSFIIAIPIRTAEQVAEQDAATQLEPGA
jgi:two-component system NtrC family sensor kinase